MTGVSATNQVESIDPLPVGELLARLRDARTYDHPTQNIEILETHISWIILTGEFAYKIKKPVDLGFLDFSTLERRRHYCFEELRLNRRLAEELYIDVVPIGIEAGHPRVGASPACEYAVKMHQFGLEDRLDQLIVNKLVDKTDIEALARRVADFHDSLPEADAVSNFGSVETVSEQIADNFAQLARYLGQREVNEFDLLKLRSASEALLHRRINAISERKQLGAVRECHGDLHTRNVVRFNDELMPYDCLEFDESIRTIDKISEVAFMVMDLLACRRTDLAYAFLNAYLEKTGDYDGIELLRLYLAYECLVRAKVEAITDAQRTHKDTASYCSLTARYARLARTILLDTEKPWIVAMHGYSGSGKSWLADRLSLEFPAIRVRSDVERKRLRGLDARAASGSAIESGLYSPEYSLRTYRRLNTIAQTCVTDHFNVIVDAAFLAEEHRMALADMARNAGANFAIINCTADQRVLEQRVSARGADNASVSEAGLDVLAHQQATADPLAPHEKAITVDVPTDTPPTVQELAKRIRRIGGS